MDHHEEPVTMGIPIDSSHSIVFIPRSGNLASDLRTAHYPFPLPDDDAKRILCLHRVCYLISILCMAFATSLAFLIFIDVASLKPPRIQLDSLSVSYNQSNNASWHVVLSIHNMFWLSSMHYKNLEVAAYYDRFRLSSTTTFPEFVQRGFETVSLQASMNGSSMAIKKSVSPHEFSVDDKILVLLTIRGNATIEIESGVREHEPLKISFTCRNLEAEYLTEKRIETIPGVSQVCQVD